MDKYNLVYFISYISPMCFVSYSNINSINSGRRRADVGLSQNVLASFFFLFLEQLVTDALILSVSNFFSYWESNSCNRIIIYKYVKLVQGLPLKS